MSVVETTLIPASELAGPLRLLEEWLRDNEPVSDEFVKKMQGSIEAGDIEVLAARLDGRISGVLVLAFRPNVSLGGLFASVEDLYVSPIARRKGVGAALLKAADERCTKRGISYLEVQVEENDTNAFYAAFGYEPEPDVRVFSRSLTIGDSGDEKLKADG